MRRTLVLPAHPERICWGCDKYCGADDLACGNGTIRTPHPCELFGDDWLEWSHSRLKARDSGLGTGRSGEAESKAAASRLVPATGLPLLYFAFAHFCLALAFAALVVSPGLPAGFFHHPRMVALVHLVTLGWITSSILGAFYIVGPLALRMPLPAGPLDRLAFAGYAGGVAGHGVALLDRRVQRHGVVRWARHRGGAARGGARVDGTGRRTHTVARETARGAGLCEHARRQRVRHWYSRSTDTGVILNAAQATVIATAEAGTPEVKPASGFSRKDV